MLNYTIFHPISDNKHYSKRIVTVNSNTVNSNTNRCLFFFFFFFWVIALTAFVDGGWLYSVSAGDTLVIRCRQCVLNRIALVVVGYTCDRIRADQDSSLRWGPILSSTMAEIMNFLTRSRSLSLSNLFWSTSIYPSRSSWLISL